MIQRHSDDPDDDALRRAYQGAIGDAAGPHLTEDDWVRLASDEVSDAARAAHADHIAQCGACATTWRALEGLRAEAATFDAGAPRPVMATRAWALGPWAGLAAAAVVVLAVSTTLQRGGHSATPPASSSAPVASSSTPAAAAPAPAAAPAWRDWATLPAAPAVTLPPSLALTMRGATGDRDAFLTAFGPAIAPYRKGRYAEAATALGALSARFESVPEVWFYLGVSRLLAGAPADAVPALTRATTSDAVGAQAVWLRVVALERAGRADEATAALRASCDSATLDVHRAACAALTTSR